MTADDEAWIAEQEDRQSTWNECYERIAVLAREISIELEDDYPFDRTWAIFARFAEEIKPPADRGRPPRRSNPSRDEALIKAYTEAPPGEKKARVIAAGAEQPHPYTMSSEAAWRQLRRLRKEAQERWAWLPASYRPPCWADDGDK